MLGLSEATADSTLTAVNLAVGTVARQCSDTAAKNTITGQTPVAGAQAAYGSAVALVVSSGPCNTTVPNVVGLSQTVAEATLEGAYPATATATQQCSDTVPDGVVISQTPESGQHAASGTEVALVVSSGACTRTVPNLAGMAELTARMTISGAHLTVGVVAAQCSNSAGAGAVISQNPAEGTTLPIGGRVDLIMSTGPCEGVEPTDAQLQSALLSGFQSMDGDGDGQISYFEALLALPDLSVIAFNNVDSNGDGWISRDEAGLDQESGGCKGGAGGKGAFTVEKLKSVFGSLFFAGPGPGVLILLSRK